MKIVKLTAENIKKLRAVEITPNGDVVTISGKNGAGKTSVLDSIWWALSGTTHIQAQPIRKGETKARIRLDMGEIIVERKFTESGSTLVVENAEGARFPSPQKMLDAMIGELSFDPLAFSRMDARKQFDELRRVSELDVDIDELDRLNKSDYAKRTDINRDAKLRRAIVDGIAIADIGDAKQIDESELVAQLQKAGEHNTEIETRRARRSAAQETANQKKRESIESSNRAAKLREEADALDIVAKVASDEAIGIEEKINSAAPLPNPIDVTVLRQQIESAMASNKAVIARDQAIERKNAAIKEATELEAKSKDITKTMDAREKAKSDAISRAVMPVDGLGFGDGIVMYRNVPFDQASSAEQLRVSLSIAMAANPKLRVIRIQDGSLLDDNGLASIAEMAKDNDYQIWIERVDNSGKIGIVIDDGSVATKGE